MPLEHSPTRQAFSGQRTMQQPTEVTFEETVRSEDNLSSNQNASLIDGASIEVAQKVRLPPFWKENPVLWFTQVEAAFLINRIVKDESKFRYVTVYLDNKVLPLVEDILICPPENNKYLKLKERICNAFGESKEAKIRKLLGSHVLGDEKPSVFLHRLNNLAPGQINNEVLRSIFLEQLPENIRSILAISEVKDLSKLAIQADQILDMSRPTSSSVFSIESSQGGLIKKMSEEITELRKQMERLTHQNQRRERSFSRGRSNFKRWSTSQSKKKNEEGKKYCFYHDKFGDKAHKCVQPCSFGDKTLLEN
ncbi:uncharacterized protein LOC143217842 [Lasioglossum baleicum]|uniref:uncharacterized protein LOC143217842 n=1 Tax=Lasioglossum baleicum TaxID=434251 RepID=UPI003FCEC410